MNATRKHASSSKKRFLICSFAALLGLALAPSPCRASSEGGEADFVDIPVGGRPAAMGGAYSALANDAYAAALNPGGLGFVGAAQAAGQHLSYLESSRYDALSAAVPLGSAKPCSNALFCPGTSLGASIQYFGSGQIQGTDASGNDTGGFSTHFAAYSLSAGRAVTSRLSLGVTGKVIDARIADVSADAYAADFGSMYRLNRRVTLSAVLANVGTKLKFLNEGDPLPTAFHAGAAYQVEGRWGASVESVYGRDGQAGARLGFELHPTEVASLRLSYRTDMARRQGALGGVAAGFGLQMGRLDFSYAWMPMSDLGVTHYVSFGVRFDRHQKNQQPRGAL